MDTSHIEGLTGLVVGLQPVGVSGFKSTFVGFGVSGEYAHGAIVMFAVGSDPFPDSILYGENGQKVKEMIEHAAVIFIFKPDYVMHLKSLAKEHSINVVLFSSIFGMLPHQFLTASPFFFETIDYEDSEALAVEVAAYLQSNLLEYYIFGPWIQYIKGTSSERLYTKGPKELGVFI
jgi:hypothetical protein